MATQADEKKRNTGRSSASVAENDAAPACVASSIEDKAETPASTDIGLSLDEGQAVFPDSSEQPNGDVHKDTETLRNNNAQLEANEGQPEKNFVLSVQDAGVSDVANMSGNADLNKTADLSLSADVSRRAGLFGGTCVPRSLDVLENTDRPEETVLLLGSDAPGETEGSGEAEGPGETDTLDKTDALDETETRRETGSSEATTGKAVTNFATQLETEQSGQWEPNEDEKIKMRAKLSKRGGWDAVGLEAGDQFREYMQYKNRKLREQFAHEVGMTMKRQDKGENGEQQTGKEGSASSSKIGDVFRNVVVWVDGRTNPGRLEIRNIIMRNGGQFETYWTSRVTHVVADTLAVATLKRVRTRLSASPSALKKGNPNIKMVTAQWVSQSAKMKKRLPERQFPIPGVQLPGQKSVAALLGKRPVKKSHTDGESTSNTSTSSGVKKFVAESPKRLRTTQKHLSNDKPV